KNALIIAHRGASSIAPENTLKAFQKAIELGADMIEFDVRKTIDDRIVISHDNNLIRITGKFGSIKNMTLEQLREFDFGEGEKIPTLKELINLTKGKIDFNCEVKVRGIEQKLVDIFRDADLLDSTLISSFKDDVLIKIQKIEPKLRLAALNPNKYGWISSWVSRKKMIKKAKYNRFYAINPIHVLLNKRFIDKAHQSNLKIYPWTVNSESRMEDLVRLGVDGIITNDIQLLKNCIMRMR
ncbi:MAG: glycerophosphodiester phosphodiesterase, partial [Promethearchaeota archaeon]